LFTKSLARGGVLCLGNKESLQFSSVSAQYLTLSKDERIYRLNPAAGQVQPRAERGVRTRPRVRGAAPADVARVPGVCVIGGSLGSLALLRELLPALPADFPLPILIVTHQAPNGPNALVGLLSPDCALAIKEAVAGDTIQPGTVYLSAPGYHLLLEADWSLAFSSEPPERHARPSINLLLESVASVCAKQAIGIILTGLNDDGASGLAALQAAGGTCLVQDPAEAVAPSMPLAAIKACALSPQHVLPLAQLVDALQRQAAQLAARRLLFA
jgi:two-component system chemotaxis response regulator CheB